MNLIMIEMMSLTLMYVLMERKTKMIILRKEIYKMSSIYKYTLFGLSFSKNNCSLVKNYTINNFFVKPARHY